MGQAMNKLPWMCILWPSFLAACALEMLTFALIDPAELKWAHMPNGFSAQGIYSIAFFTFWAMTLSSSFTTAWLTGSQPASNDK
jgi:hypothetical protein